MIQELSKINEYVYSKIKEKDPILLILEEEAKEKKVPIITKEVAEFLKMLLSIKKCHNALEIGTAIGYSGIYIAREITGTLTTIEINETRYQEAKKNFKKAKLNNIKQILGDATEQIKDLESNFDFVFIDAAKGQYKTFFEIAYSKLNSGGMIVIDNVLFRGYVCGEEIPKRYRTLVKKLDIFIDELYLNYKFSLLPFGDGVGIVFKEKK